MGGHKIVNQNEIHFVTCTVVGWIDVFTRIKYKNIIIESFNYCIQEKGLTLYAYVIMSNHIHFIGEAKAGSRLSDIIRDFKKYTANQTIKYILNNKRESRSDWMLRLFKYYAKNNKNNKVYQFWQRSNKPIELQSEKWYYQKLDYIHLNPVRAGIVKEANEYIYSSASRYLERGDIDDAKLFINGLKSVQE